MGSVRQRLFYTSHKKKPGLWSGGSRPCALAQADTHGGILSPPESERNITTSIRLRCFQEITQINDEVGNVDCSQMATGDGNSGGTWANQDEKIKGKMQWLCKVE